MRSLLSPLALMLACLAGLIFAAGILVGVWKSKPIMGTALQIRAFLSDLERDPRAREQASTSPPGFTNHSDFQDDGFLLVSAYFVDNDQVEIRLVRLSDGATVKHWRPDPHELRTKLVSPHFRQAERFTPQSPLLLDDGGIAFIDNQGPLVRLDSCSNIKWITDGQYHHSLERDEVGNFLVPYAEMKRDPPDFPFNARHEGIAVVGGDGTIKKRVSLTKTLVENGFYALLTIPYPTNPDITHLNDVEAAHSDSAYWKKGDWVLSLREPNLIAIYRPSTGKITWSQTGPWVNQHDPDFLPDNKIAVFGNDVLIPRRPGITSADFHFIWGHSNIYIYDFATGAVTKPYDRTMAEHNIRTPSQGRSRVFTNGDAFVEETDIGRLVRFSETGLVWPYHISDGEEAGKLNWSRYLTAAEIEGVNLDAVCTR